MPQETATSTGSNSTKVLLATIFGAMLALSTVSSMYVFLGWHQDRRAVRSIRSGAWSDPQTWQGGRVPNSYEPVVVEHQHEVVFDQPNDGLTNVHVLGTLILASDLAAAESDDASMPTTLEVPDESFSGSAVVESDASNSTNSVALPVTAVNPDLTVDNASMSLAPGRTADINGDGDVNIFDATILTSPSRWGTDNPQSDLNADGVVDVYDLSLLLS